MDDKLKEEKYDKRIKIKVNILELVKVIQINNKQKITNKRKVNTSNEHLYSSSNLF